MSDIDFDNILSLGEEVQKPSQEQSIPRTNVLPSDVYQITVESAFFKESPTGRVGVEVLFKEPKANWNHRKTYWITSDAESGRTNYYERDGKQIAYRGLVDLGELTQSACNKTPHEMKRQNKMINIWDWNSNSMQLQKKLVMPELFNKTVTMLLHQVKRNKRVQDASGKWVDSPDIRDENEIVRVYPPASRLSEDRKEVISEWKKANKDVVVNRAKHISPAVPVVQSGKSGPLGLDDDLPF